MTLEQQISDHRMKDTYGGYVWGQPVQLWTTTRRRRPKFTAEQLAIAIRSIEKRTPAA